MKCAGKCLRLKHVYMSQLPWACIRQGIGPILTFPPQSLCHNSSYVSFDLQSLIRKEHFLNYPFFNHAKLSCHFVRNSLKGNLHIVNVIPLLIHAKPQLPHQGTTIIHYKCLFTGLPSTRTLFQDSEFPPCCPASFSSSVVVGLLPKAFTPLWSSFVICM